MTADAILKELKALGSDSYRRINQPPVVLVGVGLGPRLQNN